MPLSFSFFFPLLFTPSLPLSLLLFISLSFSLSLSLSLLISPSLYLSLLLSFGQALFLFFISLLTIFSHDYINQTGCREALHIIGSVISISKDLFTRTYNVFIIPSGTILDLTVLKSLIRFLSAHTWALNALVWTLYNMLHTAGA